MYLLGLDIGSSSIKAALVRANDGATVCLVQSPHDVELEIDAPHPGWAEQEPETWWRHVCQAVHRIFQQSGVQADDILSIGIAYQMHGLVAVDRQNKVVRPAIIWCDSRAVETGEKALQSLGPAAFLPRTLNPPGNFTASKLRWIQEHEPENFQRIYKIMLPGDYIAMRLSGDTATTVCGLSEGILWDFQTHQPAGFLLDHWGISKDLLPAIVPVTGIQGRVSRIAAKETGLLAGTPIGYRAGDQPNNALALNVLRPGEIAATGGTSGVVYGVSRHPLYDEAGRINAFAHVNHSNTQARIGMLLCINGAGIQYGWLKKHMNPAGERYTDMEHLAATIPVGADGLRILPFGNGAERMLGNKDLGAQVLNWHFNRHHRGHWYRAALEGVAFAFVYGMDILRNRGLDAGVIRVGNDNLFQSDIFSNTIATLSGCQIDVMKTNGAVGAARAAGVAVQAFGSIEEAVENVSVLDTYIPSDHPEDYLQAYVAWNRDLQQALEIWQINKTL